MDPEHKAAKSNLDLVSYLGRVSYREILSSLRNREHDHAVDLIEASIQKGEDPDRLLRALASSFPGFFGPVTDRLIERKSWDLALSLLELWETYRPAAAPGIQGNRGYIYILTGQMEEARRIHDELVSFYTKPEGTFLGPLKFFEHFGTQIKMPRLIFKLTPSYTDAAIKSNVQGVILCSVVVEVDGTISNPQVIKGLGHGLDESALREFQQWRFAPGTLNGEPIRVRATIEVTIKSRRIIR